MKANSFGRYSLKPLGYAVYMMLIMWLTTAANTDHYTYQDSRANKASVTKGAPEPRLFLIAVADTNDDSIGERCRTDLGEITDELEDIADEIDAHLIEPKVISGDSFSKAAVSDAIDNWLQRQHPSRNDIVMFYYTGHGFRYPADESKYPRMWLKTATDKNIERNNLRMEEDVYDRIVKMGAGMNLVISDCCNNTVADDDGNIDNVMVPTRPRQTHDHNQTPGEDEYAIKLFNTNHPVSILVTAASKGELAGGTAKAGGFFTKYFLDALDKCIYDNSIHPSWKAIFGYADDKVGYWARSAACPTAKHNAQGRCVQETVVKIAEAD